MRKDIKNALATLSNLCDDYVDCQECPLCVKIKDDKLDYYGCILQHIHPCRYLFLIPKEDEA